MPKVGLVSLGCPKNTVDSEVMLGVLRQSGYEITPQPEDADVLIVNTCSFIQPAKQESIDTILEMAEYKKRGRARRLVVTGCLVERYRRDILNEFPEVDYVLGTNEIERVVEACDLRSSGREARAQAEPYLYHQGTPRVLSTPSHSAFIKIAEGCDHTCSFCVIPQMRGKFRSRRFDSIIHEAENLIRGGARELTLVGQDNTNYGEDLGLRDGLARLLKQLASLDGLVWLRFLYCYPNRVTDALIEAVASSPKIAKYFDIPFQHASRPVLKAMRRGSDGAQFLRLIRKIRAAIPGVALRTSLIVGFPGETEDDFQALREFVSEASFDRLGVFQYSNEESSASFSLRAQVPAATVRRRKNTIMAVQRRISRNKLKKLAGHRLPVLVEGRLPEMPLLFSARLESQAPEVDGRVLLNDFEGPEPRAGEYRWARVTQASDYDVVATLEPDYFADPAVPYQDHQTIQGLVQIQSFAARSPAYALPHL